MRRYTIAPPRTAYVADLWDMPVEPLNITVFEREDTPRPVGLLDHLGRPLYAVEERERIGFPLTRDNG